MASVHIMLMDHVRSNYLKTEDQLKKEREEKQLKEEQERKKAEDKEEIMKYWRSHDQKKQSSNSKDNGFNCQRFV